jgi:hypothetical protein
MFRRHLTFANLVAASALFLVVSGVCLVVSGCIAIPTPPTGSGGGGTTTVVREGTRGHNQSRATCQSGEVATGGGRLLEFANSHPLPGSPGASLPDPSTDGDTPTAWIAKRPDTDVTAYVVCTKAGGGGITTVVREGTWGHNQSRAACQSGEVATGGGREKGVLPSPHPSPPSPPGPLSASYPDPSTDGDTPTAWIAKGEYVKAYVVCTKAGGGGITTVVREGAPGHNQSRAACQSGEVVPGGGREDVVLPGPHPSPRSAPPVQASLPDPSTDGDTPTAWIAKGPDADVKAYVVCTKAVAGGGPPTP